MAPTPEDMSNLEVDEIEKLIYPAGFYKNKSAQIKTISTQLVNDYNSIVPDSIEELLKFKGVGRKTANLVVTLGYKKLGICVDTHVHRISNRLGYVSTKTPDETEMALREKLPQKHWLTINDLLVAFGQNHCFPVSPRCTTCKLTDICPKTEVKKYR